MPLEPCRLFLQSARAEFACPNATDLLRGDEPGQLQDADVLHHPREGHVEFLGEVRDRSVRASELLQNAASGGVPERAERGIEAGLGILNHTVKYYTRTDRAQGRGSGFRNCSCACWPREEMALSGGGLPLSERQDRLVACLQQRRR